MILSISFELLCRNRVSGVVIHLGQIECILETLIFRFRIMLSNFIMAFTVTLAHVKMPVASDLSSKHLSETLQ